MIQHTSGIVKAIGNGSAIITVETSNKLKANCSIVVAYNEIFSIYLSKTSVTFTRLDETEKLKVTSNPSDVPLNTIIWSSSNVMVARVDNEGVITPIKNGTAIITATTENGKSSSCLVNVKTKLSSIYLNKTSFILINYGDTELLIPKIVNSSGSQMENVTWISSNDLIVTVNSDGLVTAKGSGTVTITAKLDNENIATCEVTVVEHTIKISKTFYKFNKLEESIQLVAWVYPISEQVTWKSSDEKIASVDKYGIVTSKGYGEAKITATLSSGSSVVCTIVVLDAQNIEVDWNDNINNK